MQPGGLFTFRLGGSLVFFEAEPRFGVKVILCLTQPQNRQDDRAIVIHLITIEHIALNYSLRG